MGILVKIAIGRNWRSANISNIVISREIIHSAHLSPESGDFPFHVSCSVSTPTGLGAVNTTSARPQHGQLKHIRGLNKKRYNDGLLKWSGLDNC